MGFWKIAGDLAKDIARDYYEDRGPKGLIEDAANLARSAKQMFSNEEEDDDDYDEFENNFVEMLNEGEFDEAEDYVRSTYQREGMRPDSFYYYCLASARAEKAREELSVDLYCQAKDLAIKGRNICPIGNQLYKNLDELIGNIDERRSNLKHFIKNYETFKSVYDDLLFNKNDHQGAVNFVKQAYKQYEWDIDSEYHYKIAIALDMCGDEFGRPDKLQEALFHINQALELEPDNAEIIREKSQIEHLIQSQASRSTKSDVKESSASDSEKEYLDEIKACFADDGVISDRERRLLDKLRISLGISEQRAAELEAQVNPNSLSDDEKEYAEEVKACLADDGIITDRERRLLDRLRKSLGISEQRALDIEKSIK